MPITSGTKLGPYEVLSAIGAGGMGEVYKARDSRLNRTVAIKVLPQAVSANAELKARFEREARALSSFQHSNICTLYDVGHQDGIDFLVMEFLEGENLATRLYRGPLPTDQVLRIGIELADALDKAHRLGLVHRDLKPGNIILTKSGAKLLDFGLAKEADSALGANAMTAMATRSQPLTAEGTILGTYFYMAPEQLEGREADARADIFAFGTILYEMATGQRAFDGRTQASVIASILASEPKPLNTLVPTAPASLDHVIRTCLAKDPDERFQSARDLVIQLRFIANESASSTARMEAVAPRKKLSRDARLAWISAAILLLVASAALFGWWRAESKPQLVIRSVLSPPEKSVLVLVGDFAGPPVISPDGTAVAMLAQADGVKSIWLRTLNDSKPRRLEGTEDAVWPFWSADSKSIAFFAHGKLSRIPAGGGPTTTITEGALNSRGGSWGKENIIVYSPDFQGPLLRVSAAGGPTAIATHFDIQKHTTHRWPFFLPDGKHFLYLATNHSGGDPRQNGIYMASITGGDDRFILASDAGAEYADGMLLFHAQSSLMAQSFDPSTGKLSGEPVNLIDHIQNDVGVWRTMFSVSNVGSMIYHQGTAAVGNELAWFDRSGKIVGKRLPRDTYRDPQVSPDGKHLAVSVGDPLRSIWVVDVERGSSSRLTFDNVVHIDPTWSPDGKQVAYTNGSNSQNSSISIKPVDGSGADHILVQGTAAGAPIMSNLSPDGKYVVYCLNSGPSGNSIVAMSLADHQVHTVVTAPSPLVLLSYPRVSPDGKWLAYTSTETSSVQIYVTSFPEGHGRWQISVGGGDMAAWRKDGKELFYMGNSEVYAASVSYPGSQFNPTQPQLLFRTDDTIASGRIFDAAPDGSRFVLPVVQLSQEGSPTNLLQNWPAELSKK